MKSSNLPTTQSKKILSGGRRPIGTRRVPLAACASALAAIALAPAAKATFYWTGFGSTEAWNSLAGSTNWSTLPNAVSDPGRVPASTDDVVFTFTPENNANATTLGQDISIKGLTFVGGLTTPVSIGGGNVLTVGVDGITVNAGSTSNTLGTNVAVGAAEIWANDSVSATSLTFSGVISGSSALTLEGTGSVLTPSGTFAFSGTNSYTGSLTLLNDFTALTLSGNGSLNNVSGITLGGGTTLTLDNTTSAVSRLGSGINVTTKGSTINLIGNAGATTDAIGALNLNTGQTTVNVSGASTTFTVGTLPRSIGSSVAFNPTGGATIATTGITNTSFLGQTATIIGGYAVFGPASGGTYVANDTSTINWATVSGSNIAALGSYGSSLASGVNDQIKNATQTLAAGTTHVNSLYVAGTGSAANAASVSFTIGANANTLIVDSGGIISSGGTDKYSFNGQSYFLINANSIGNNNFNGNSGAAFDEAGSITSGTGDLSVFTANGSSLRLGMFIINNGTTTVGLTKNGNGILDLSQGNNQTKVSNGYSGITTVNGGILFINNETQLGVDPASFVANQLTLNGGELRSSAGITLVANRGITVGPQGGAISYAGGGTFTSSSTITGPGGMTFAAIAGTNGGEGGTSNADQMAISLVNATYQGPTTVETATQSFINLGTNNPFPTNTALTVTHGFAPGNSTTAEGTTANIFLLAGHNLAVGSLAGEGNLSNSGGTAPVLTVGSNNISTTYTGILGGGATNTSNQTVNANFSLVKTGTANLTLTSANLYTGGTTINNGGIIVLNSTGSGTGTVGVTVNGSSSGSGVLGGTGIVAGLVTVNSLGALAPTVSGTSFSTLRLNGGLTLNAGSILNFNLGTPNPVVTTVNTTPSSDNIFVTGALTMSGAETINLANVNIPGSVLSGPTPAIYQLLTDASGVPAINPANFTINGPSLYVYSVAQDTVNDSIDLTVTKNPNPSLKWVGAPTPGNGIWDIGTTAAWNQTGVGQTTYADGALLTFDNTPGQATTVVTLNSTVQPGSITFNNNGLVSYVFNGTGSIAGSTGFIQNNVGSITFNTVNTATGTANLTNGAVIVGAGGALNNASYIIGGSAALTVNGSLSNSATAINNAGTFTLGAAGAVPSTSALIQSGSGQAILNNSVTLASVTGPSTSSIQIASGKKLTVAGTSQIDSAISGAGNLGVSGGVVTLSNGGNSYGTTGVTGGTLLVTNSTGSATGSGAVHVFTGGTLDGTGSATGAITIDSGAKLQGTGTFGSVGGVTLAGTLSPAGDGTVGTINLGATTISTGASLNIDLGALGVGNSDFASITGVLNLSGTDTVNIDPLVGATIGNYIIATASSITGGATFNPVVNTAGAGFNPLFNYSISVVGHNLVLNAAFPVITWTGSSSNNWNFTDQNWSSGSHLYTDANQAQFTDNGTNTSVVLDANIAPQGGVIFNNNGVTYSFGADVNAPNGIGGAGTVTVAGTGTVNFTSSLNNTYTGGTTITSGTLNAATDANLGAVPGAATPGSLTIGDGGTFGATSTFTLSANRGVAVGSTGGAGSTINVAGGSTLTYSGIVANINGQTGILNKTGSGELDLFGANTFTGGLNVNGGAVRLSNASAGGGAGTTVTVNNSIVAFGAGVTSNIVANTGSTLGVAGAQTLGGSITLNGNTTLDTFDPISGTTGAGDFIFNGTLSGSSTVTFNSLNGTTPETSALRFRGGASTFSGQITIPSSGKMEVFTSAASATPVSPIGSATVVMTAGAIGTTNAAPSTPAFSLFDVRNSSSGNTTFGNNVRMAGSGTAVINILNGAENGSGGTAPTQAVSAFGNLDIGPGQNLGVVANSGVQYGVSFSSVTTEGGAVGIGAGLTNGGVNNSSYTLAGNVILGAIAESGTSTGTSITFSGYTNGTSAGTISLTAANSYTGSTTITGSTVALGVPGALPSGTALTVNGGTLSFNNGAASNDQSVSSLAGTGGTITNSDATNAHTFTVNQSGITTYAGSISGNLNLTKSGAGSLTLNGPVTSTGSVLSSGGGSLTFGAASSVGAVTVSGGSTLAIGDAPASLTASSLSLTSTNTISFELGGTTAGTAGTVGAAGTAGNYSQLFIINGGAVTLGGKLSLTLTPAYTSTVAFGDTQFITVGASSLTGTFSNLGHDIHDGSLDLQVGNVWFDVSLNANAALNEFSAPGGTDIAVTVVAVPEPGSFATILSGLGMLVGLQRFRRRS